MKTKRSVICHLLMFLLLVLFTSGCGGRTLVRGKVIDDETGKPIEGAVVAILWDQCKGNSCLGFVQIADGFLCDELEKADGVTDAEGNFEVPKYAKSFVPPYPNFEMGVYKKGYVMWNDHWILYPERYYEENKAGKRKLDEYRRWDLKNGMIIRLSRWNEEYSEIHHARHACGTAEELHSELLLDAATSECVLREGYRKRGMY